MMRLVHFGPFLVDMVHFGRYGASWSIWCILVHMVHFGRNKYLLQVTMN